MEALLSKLASLEIALEASGTELHIYDPNKELTPELLSVIKERKQELLALLQEALPEEALQSITPAPPQEFYPLSYAQRRLFFLQKYDPASIAYNIPELFVLEGALDVQRLSAAFQQLVERHESLRTCFNIVQEGPVQQILPAAALQIEHTSVLPGEVQEMIRRFIRPFDLGQAPLMRAGLLQTGSQEQLLMLDMHHIIADGISQGLLIRDFIALYNGQQLPPISLHYKDYAVWQQGQQAALEKQRTFWLNEFSGEVLPLDLPADFPRPAEISYEGNAVEFTVPAQVAAGLKEIGAAEDTTLFMVLLAAYNVLLAGLTNQDDVVVGIPTAGRRHADVESMIGMFVNTLPVRNHLHADSTFREFVKAVSSRTINCFDNQDYPNEELLEELKLPRTAARHPLFSAVFDFLNFEQAVIAVPGLTVRPYHNGHGTAKFDLTLYAMEKNGQLTMQLEYAVSLFKEETVKRFAAYFNNVLETVARRPQIKISAISILSAAQQQQLLSGFNNTQLDYPNTATIVTLFEQQVQRVPDKTALVYEGKSLSFRELNEAANGLAHQLITQLNGNNSKLVAVVAERSERMLLAMLAVLKAGLAYLPLDPSYPEDRIAYILEDSEAAILLSDQPEKFPAFNGTVFSLHQLPESSAHNPVATHTSRSLCYMIYTSGSTGHPKGVMISHYNVVNFFAGMNQRLPVQEDDCMLAITSTSFDISVLELFWTLCQGVTVVVHPSHIALNNLGRYVQEEDQTMDFSLLFFSSYNTHEQGADKYRLLLDAVKYADETGFNAVWIPERHFHEFGGLYPNPAVISAALAATTSRIMLRSGSVVAPLHDPIRIAEEWAVVDNLSGGRVALSFASGWNPNDFALNEQAYANRHQLMYRNIEEVRNLWRGGTVSRVNGQGKTVSLQIFPRPVQQELPVWITAAGNAETFANAGAIGANVLTHLLGQDLDDLSAKIARYRNARKEHGHEGPGTVSLMLHTYIGENINEVEQLVEAPFIAYLESALGLSRILHEEAGISDTAVPEERKRLILKNAFLRYYKTGALIGTKRSCAGMLRRLKEIGVDEIACLVDFGIPQEKVLQGLTYLKELKDLFAEHRATASQRVTMLQSTPSFMQQAMESPGSLQLLQSLRLLLLGGEAVPAVLVHNLQQVTPAGIYNMYGPTETTIWSCVHEFEASPAQVSVGRPIANTQLYILNRSLELLPPGVAGDLYIGGDGLSAGYWKRPALTAERFIPNPHAKGALMYRTGDIARWQADGTVVVLGREDHQVKIRGHRVELGEIESRLALYPGVREAVVVARQEHNSHFLAAYYTAESAYPLDALRAHIAASLPEYMVPSYFIHLAALPLTPNGKIDRKALPAPGITAAEDYVPPADAVEQTLVTLWAEVLKLDAEKVSTTSDFFRSGGHSLNAMILVNRIERTFEVNIPLREFYSLATAGELAAYIRKAAGLQRSSTAAADKIMPAPPQAAYPLSSQQKRMFFLYELDRDSLTYNESGIYMLEGALDLERLLAACRKLIARHEILRTTFSVITDEPVQHVATDVDFSIELLKMEKDIESTVRGFIRPFNLQHAPLLRVGVLQLSQQEHLLVMDLHHIITDGVSKVLLVNDLIALYDQAVLPAPGLHYKDYAVWQQQPQQQELLQKQRAFWLQRFAELPPALELPADFPRPAVKDRVAEVWRTTLGPAEKAALQQLAINERTTPYMVLLAVYSIMLAKYSNREDVVVGTPTAGRRHTDLEHMMGMFVNTLPLRSYPRGAYAFRQYLDELKDRSLECFDNQAYPYEELINGLKIQRDTTRNPLFDAFFVFHNFEAAEMAIPGLRVKQYDRVYHISKFDIILEVFETDAHIALNFEYAAELFRGETIEKMAAAFHRLLLAVLDNVDVRIADLEITSEEERRKLLQHFNDTAQPYADDVAIHTLFELQAACTPHNIALRCNTQTTTYAQLQEQAACIAACLRVKAQLQPGDIAAVILERDAQLLPVIFGILKAGGVYMPLDPYAPAERINTMLAGSGAEVLITRSSCLQTGIVMPNFILDLDKDMDVIQSCTASLPDVPVKGSDLAYIIHTSGSTGVPKGVMIPHHAVVNRLQWMQRTFPLTEQDVLLQKTPLVFDVSVWELFWWSFTGASLCILPPLMEKEPQEIIKAVQEQGVSVIHFVPSMLSAFLAFIDQENAQPPLSALKRVFASGEALKPEQAARFSTLVGQPYGTRLVNLYGPTEATVDVSWYECREDGQENTIPIGKPIDNIRLYILDNNLKLLPAGTPGELCIAGAGLAAGYLHLPELTRERFTHAPEPVAERIYRSGDLARWLPDGNIEYLGRMDNQVKIRGYRIELGEIETMLAQYSGINETVALIKEQEEEKFIVAWYTGPAALEATELKQYLSAKLPEYMLPAAFIHLQQWPLTPNGKLDRKALPDAGITNGNGHTAPANETELALVRIWAMVLKLPEALISTTHSFFELGGHSLRGIYLINSIRQQFAVQLALRELFTHTTIQAQAALVAACNKVAPQATGIPSVGQRAYYAASAAQERLFYEQLWNPGHVTANVTVVYEIKGAFDKTRAEQTFRTLIKRHESLRTSFEFSEEGVVQLIHAEADWQFETFSPKHYAHLETAVRSFVRPFDLSTWPLMRCAVLEQEGQGQYLVVDLHHIICDGTALNILMNEFKLAYEGAALPVLPLRYVDFAAWQRGLENTLSSQEAFWRRQLAGPLPRIELPVLRERSTVTIYKAYSRELLIKGAAFDQVKKAAAHAGVSVFMYLLSVYYILIARISGSREVIIGTDADGRTAPALRQLVGTFVNVLPLRMRIPQQTSFQSFLQTVKQGLLDALENQDYQFDKMQALLDDPQSRIVEVYCSNAGFFEKDAVLRDTAFVPLSPGELPQTTRYELELNISEHEGHIHLTFLYSTDLYDSATISMLMGYYHNLLFSVMEDPVMEIGNIKLEQHSFNA